MQRIRREDALVYGLDGSLPPALRVDAGEPFAVETDDASSGLLAAGDKPPSVQNVPYVRHSPAKANPVGGPVFVEGVGRGRVSTLPIGGTGTRWRNSRRKGISTPHLTK